jgi:hypothetical protein
MRCAAVLVLLATSASAREPDGAIAPAGRWTHTRGPASGSARSHAPAIETLGEIAWIFQTKQPVRAPPLAWDGVGYLILGKSKSSTLAAIDLTTGEQLAKATLKDINPMRPAVWDQTVLLPVQGSKIVAYRLYGSKLRWRWTYDAGRGMSAPRVHAGEVYITTPRALLRLRVGRRLAVWSRPGRFTGDVAVFGPHVYALERVKGKLALAVVERLTGNVTERVEIGDDSGRPGGRVVVSEHVVGAAVPPDGDGGWHILERTTERGAVHLAHKRAVKLASSPIAFDDRLFALTALATWSLESPARGVPVVLPRRRRDLFVAITAPVALSGTAVMGSWAANLRTREILWRLDEHTELWRASRKGLRFAIPVDKLLLMIPRDGLRIYAVKEELIGS